MTDRLRTPSTMVALRRRSSEAPLLDDPSRAVVADDQRTCGRTATAVVQDISPDGAAMVVLAGETRSCETLTVLRYPTADAAAEALLGRTVLVFVNECGRPVILGVVAEQLWETRPAAVEAQATLPPGKAVAVHADKRRLDLEATDEIRLTCGKSSLVLRSDGTVVVRGVNIVSRALQSHKIRGATVSVN